MIEIIAGIYTGTDFAVGGASSRHKDREHGAVDHLVPGRQQCYSTVMEVDHQRGETSEEPLVLAILVASTATLVVAFVYWILLLRTACRQPSVFPQLLLLSVFLGSSSSLVLVLMEPNTSCFVFVLHPVSYSLVYSSLLVRLTSLRLHQQSLPVSSIHQALVFFLSILLQLSATSHHLLMDGCPSKIPSRGPGVHLLRYFYCLLCLLLCLAVVPLLRATREVCLTFVSLLLSSLSWVGWVVMAFVFPNQLELIKQLGLQVSLISAMIVLPFPNERSDSSNIQAPGYLFVTQSQRSISTS